MQLWTQRLRLVAATPAFSRVERDGVKLARALGAIVPDGWPPPEMAVALGAWTAALAQQPELVGWVNWYWLCVARPRSDVVIGYGGFKGMPSPDGVVELGFAVLDRYQRQGYAREALSALVDWAWRDERVRRIDAETRFELPRSIALLEHLGFRELPQTDPELRRYGLDRPPNK